MKELQKEIEDLQKEIAFDKKNEEIEAIEEEQEEINKMYEKMLSDKEIFGEVDRLLTTGNMEEMLKLLQNYEVDYSDVGTLLGKSFADSFREEIENALDALDMLMGRKNEFETPSKAPSVNTNGSNTNNTNSGGGGAVSSPAPTVQRGSRVRVNNVSEAIYRDSQTSKSSGTWKGAGVSSNDTLYVVNDNNGRVALSRTNDINGAIGWIRKSQVSAFDTGGMTARDGFAMLHDKERVLSAEQTRAFNKLVYDILPQLKDLPTFFNGVINGVPRFTDNGDVISNVINNEWNITNNTPLDVETMEKDINKVFKSELRKFGSLKGS